MLIEIKTENYAEERKGKTYRIHVGHQSMQVNLGSPSINIHPIYLESNAKAHGLDADYQNIDGTEFEVFINQFITLKGGGLRFDSLGNYSANDIYYQTKVSLSPFDLKQIVKAAGEAGLIESFESDLVRHLKEKNGLLNERMNELENKILNLKNCMSNAVEELSRLD